MTSHTRHTIDDSVAGDVLNDNAMRAVPLASLEQMPRLLVVTQLGACANRLTTVTRQPIKARRFVNMTKV